MSTIILLAASFPAELKDRITGIAGNGPRCRVAGPFDPPTGAALSPGDAAAVRVLVTMGTLRTDAEVMARLPSLGLICCYGTGYEGVDLEEARKRGIMVTHSPAANAPAVADHAMALLLAAEARGLGATGIGALANYGPQVHTLLDLPEDEMVVCGVALGWPDRDAPENALRTERAALEEYATFRGL